MTPFLNQPFTLDRTVRVALLLLGIWLLGVILSSIWEVLLPFLLAGIFAYVLMPLVRFIQRRLYVRSRGIAVLIVFVLLALVLTLAGLYLVPSIEAEVSKTLQALSHYNEGRSLVEMLIPQSVLDYVRNTVNLNHLLDNLSPDKIAETLRTIWDQAGGIVSGTLSVFSWSLVFAMGIIYFIFIMVDFEGLAHGLLNLFPMSARPTLKAIMLETDYYMNSYFRGQALIALSVGTLLTIGFNIIGLPMATAMGIFIGLLNFIPYMQALGILPLGLAALLMSAQTGQGAFFCLLLAFGVLMIVQVIQDTFLVPRIMGSSMGMRPSLILLALAIWGYLLGFFGMLIALPITMAIYSVYMRFVLQDEAYIRLIDEKMKRRDKSSNKAEPSEPSSTH